MNDDDNKFRERVGKIFTAFLMSAFILSMFGLSVLCFSVWSIGPGIMLAVIGLALIPELLDAFEDFL